MYIYIICFDKVTLYTLNTFSITDLSVAASFSAADTTHPNDFNNTFCHGLITLFSMKLFLPLVQLQLKRYFYLLSKELDMTLPVICEPQVTIPWMTYSQLKVPGAKLFTVVGKNIFFFFLRRYYCKIHFFLERTLS